MVSSIRVEALTEKGKITLTEQIRAVSVTESLDESPSGSISLPLYRLTDTGRKTYGSLIRGGDQVTVHMLGWDDRGDWECVLDGVLGFPSEQNLSINDKYEAVTTFPIKSYSSIIEEDTVAWWLFAGTIEGWSPVRTKLIPDQLNGYPHRVAFNYMQNVALWYANFNLYGTELEDRIHLMFDGIKAIAPLQFAFQTASGAHMDIVRSLCLESPFHQMYVTTLPSSSIKGDKTQKAKNPVGDKDAATTIVFRTAPYPHVDQNGKGDVSAWQALPITDIDDLVVDGSSVVLGSKPKNFFLVRPGLQFLTDNNLFALATAIENETQRKRFGYNPLQISTRMFHNDPNAGLKGTTVEDYARGMGYRLAGQWNHMQDWVSGSFPVAFNPAIRIGTRVAARSPWHGGDVHEFHVQGRSLSWQAGAGGRMTLSLERGLHKERYADPAFWASGLKAVRLGAEVVTKHSRETDNPRKT